MNERLLRIVMVGAALCSLVITVGCNDEALTRQYYALDLAHRPVDACQPSPVQLEIRRFSVDSVYASKGLVYRQGPLAYQIDHYHQFVISPGQMITEKTRTWLTQSGIVTRVLDPGSLSVPTHTLEGNVTSLYGDFRSKDAPAAVVALRLYLIDHAPQHESIVLGKTYDARVPLETPDAPGLVAGYNAALEQILGCVEADLKDILE